MRRITLRLVQFEDRSVELLRANIARLTKAWQSSANVGILSPTIGEKILQRDKVEVAIPTGPLRVL